MKKNVFLAAALMAAVAGFTLAGCASMKLTSLEADTVNGPRQVRQGQDINPKDITVYGIYEDKSRKTVSLKSENIVFDKHTPGTQTVKIRVSGKEASFQTQVMALRSLTVAGQLTATLYTGEPVSSAWPGIEIRGEWDQMGSDKIDTRSCQITGYNWERAGRQTLTVSFEGKTATFSVNVVQASPLKGTWSEPGPAHMILSYTFNNDMTYERSYTGENAGSRQRGTYTISGGKITMTLSHVDGRSYPQYGCLSIKTYTRSEMAASIRLTEAGKTMTDEQINATLNRVYTSVTMDYSINGDTLTLDRGQYVKRK